MFSLPVYYSKINVGHKGTSLDSATAAKWIINTLGMYTKIRYFFSSLFSFYFRWHQQKSTVFITTSAISGILLPSSKYWQTQPQANRVHGQVD